MREARLPGFRGWAVGFALMTDQGGHVNGTPQGKDESNDPYAYLRGVLPESESASYLPPTDDVLDAVPADNDEGTRRSRRQAISRRELRAATAAPAPAPTRRLPGRILALIVFGAAVVVSVIVLVIVNLAGDGDDADPTAGSGATSVATDATSGSSQVATELAGPLYEKLPRSVTGGAVSEDGPSGAVYELQDPGYITNPIVPANSLESYVGVFAGPDLTALEVATGEEDGEASADPEAQTAVDVNLTATRWGSPEAALADATATAAALGTPVAQGVVFPDDNLGTYWVFNNDGLVTLVWHDGDLGSFSVISEGEGSALDFYYGLSF